jgi:hypothetical protein
MRRETSTITDRYGLRDYENARRLGTVIEGDEPKTNAERVAALTRGTRSVAAMEREQAERDISDRASTSFYCDRRNKVIMVSTMQEWDTEHNASAINALKVDA